MTKIIVTVAGPRAETFACLVMYVEIRFPELNTGREADLKGSYF